MALAADTPLPRKIQPQAASDILSPTEVIDKKGDEGSDGKSGHQNASDKIQSPMPVVRIQFGKQPTREIARQKKLLFFHRGLQQITDTDDANQNGDDVKIVEHGKMITVAGKRSILSTRSFTGSSAFTGLRLFTKDGINDFAEITVSFGLRLRRREFFFDIQDESFGTFEARLQLFDENFEFPDFGAQNRGDFSFIHAATTKAAWRLNSS